MDHLIQFAYLIPVYDPRDIIRLVWCAYSLTYLIIATSVFLVKLLGGSITTCIFEYCHRLTFLVIAYTLVYTIIHLLDHFSEDSKNSEILWKIHAELKKGRKNTKEKVKDTVECQS